MWPEGSKSIIVMGLSYGLQTCTVCTFCVKSFPIFCTEKKTIKIYLRTKVLYDPFLWSLKCALWYMRWSNLNIETEKSEQTVFAQISVSQY